MKHIIDDGFNPELVEKALFQGILEIPEIKVPSKIIVPETIIPFTKISQSMNYKEFIHFYEHDTKFSNILLSTNDYLDEFKKFKGVISPDCSLYIDMPLCLQIANTYMNRAIGSYLQSEGIYVIPNVRWSDERSYTTIELPEKFAFIGLPKNSILSIGTYGCIQGKDNKHYFREGLRAMIEELTPKVVLVYGSMPDCIFKEFENITKFINYPDWISSKRKKVG